MSRLANEQMSERMNEGIIGLKNRLMDRKINGLMNGGMEEHVSDFYPKQAK